LILFERFKAGLARTREATLDKLRNLLGLSRWDAAEYEQLEEILISADIGYDTTQQLLKTLMETAGANEIGANLSPGERLRLELNRLLDGDGASPHRFSAAPWVILLVGVNGSGKTTTVGKLAYYFFQQGKRSAVAAADTFRAAAIEQLEVWAGRGRARVIRQAQGADPAAVVFDAYNSVKARGEDVLIVDTAGRLQAKQNLMEELAKIRRVLNRLDASAPHEALLVLDATTGQNGLSQAAGFLRSASITGLIVTKLDGTARGGIVVPIRRQLELPIAFIGLGEAVDDLQPFDAKVYVDALLAI